MDVWARHWHYSCPLCADEAVRERCPAFRPEWELSREEVTGGSMVRLWYLDGTYMDVEEDEAWEYEADSEWSHTEVLAWGWREENGCTINRQ